MYIYTHTRAYIYIYIYIFTSDDYYWFEDAISLKCLRLGCAYIILGMGVI